jgi:hypothetical protein
MKTEVSHSHRTAGKATGLYVSRKKKEKYREFEFSSNKYYSDMLPVSS